VTRESSADEDNVAVSPDEFRRALERGDFAVHWEAHGHCYALPRNLNDDIRSGRAVVANVSRTVIGALRKAYANVVVVAITAPPDVLAQRLAARARHSDGNITERLTRSVEDASAQADGHHPQRGRRRVSRPPASARDQEPGLARIARATRRLECR